MTSNKSLSQSHRFRWLSPLFAWLAIVIGLLPIAVQAQSAGTGTVTGRVMNAGTGDYLRNAVVSVEGTNITAVAEAGGNFRLLNVPAGEVKIKAEFAGLDTLEQTVTVTAGGTTTKDFNLTNSDYNKDAILLDQFVVSGEREGNAKALQEQRNAVNMKQVIAADAFGDVSEGNAGEFLKRMSGVAIDYTEADARQIRIRGMNPKYTVVLMDGAPVASAGSSNVGTGRAFEFEQLSIASIETVELSKTPTPDQQASAVAGVVNLRSKGAFDSKGRRINFGASMALNSYDWFQNSPGPDNGRNRKVMPNFSLSYADVLIAGKLGIQAGVTYSKTFAEQKAETVGYRWDSNAFNNDTEVPIVTSFGFRDSPKVSTRINYNARIDYKFSPNAWIYTRVDYNTYEARFYSRDISINMAGTGAGQGTINSPTGAVDPSVEYSWNSQTSQTVATQGTGTYVNTSFNQGGGATNKHGATFTWTTYGEYTVGALKIDAQAQFSRATNWYSDLPDGFLWAAGTTNLTGSQFRFNRAGPDDTGVQFTQLAGNNWQNLSNYRVNTVLSNDRASDDERYSAQLNFRYPFVLKYPVTVKWGFSVNELAHNVYLRKNNESYTFVGPDHVANTADDNAAPFGEPYYRMNFDMGTNANGLTNLDRWGLAQTMRDHPDWFTGRNDVQLMQTLLQNTTNVSEQVNAAYLQTIWKIGRFSVAPGVRFEATRTRGKGPLDIGNRQAQINLGNAPTTAAPGATTPAFYPYVLARYGGNRSAAGTTYSDLFKYLHLNYQITPNLLTRASYHDSITRPDFANMFPGYTISNETAVPPTATGNVNNPDLRPEYARSVNWDIEYYFGKNQNSSVAFSVFRTDIKDLQRRKPHYVDPNGFLLVGNTNYQTGAPPGSLFNVWDNVAKAHNSGFELNYNQSLSFLPGALSGLSLFANHTHLIYDSWDNYLGSAKDISNGGLNYAYKKFSARFAVNRTGYHRDSALLDDKGLIINNGAANAGIVNFSRQRTMIDISVGYALTKKLTLFANGRNIFNEPLTTYSISSNVITRRAKFGALWTAGISGKF
ncbi:MAG: TonB-dependent receptor [Nibricoccus sp.]